MLDESTIPTRLIDPKTRPRVSIVEPVPPARFRSVIVLLRLTSLFVLAGVQRLFGRYTVEGHAVRLRNLFEEFGGLWVKAGQLLSLRIDIFSPELCRELSKLQHRAQGFPAPFARRTIEQDLGAPIESIFDEFDDMPFAAASIGQVHRAHLRRENRWVAVKVQKPYSQELFARDLVVIKWIVSALVTLRIKPQMRWPGGLWELRQIMREELDFRFEASAMRRMRKSLKKHEVYVPKVFSEYNAPHVLVSEFIFAVLMADYIKVAEEDPARLRAWLAENNIQPRVLARRLIFSLFRQLFEDNLYHGDLHPGNIVLLRDSRVVLIDFGTTAFTEREYLDRFKLFVRSLATLDYAKAADMSFLLSAVLPDVNTDAVKERLVRALRMWATRTLVPELPYHDKSVDNATVEVTTILFEENITMEWAFLRIRRAITTLDASLIYLFPKVNYTKMCQQYFEQAERRSIKKTFGPQVVTRLAGSVRTGLDIQDRVGEYMLFQSSLIRRQSQVFQGVTTKLSQVGALFIRQVAFFVLAHGVLILLVFLQQQYPELVERFLGTQLVSFAKFFPTLDTQLWLGLQLLDAYIFWSLLRLQRRLLRSPRGSTERSNG